MNKHLFYSLAVLISCCTQMVKGQDTLRLEEAISTALKNNYDIRLVANQITIAKNNANLGNAGMLPTLGGTFSDGGSRQNTRQTRSTGAQVNADGVRNTNMSYGAALDWTIFDGLQMFTNYARLKELQKQGEANAKSTILSTISNVVSSYYAVVRQQKLVRATDSAMKISRLRVVIAENKLQIGRGSKLDVVTAKVDYNTDTTTYLQQKNLLNTSKITLNQWMARDLNITFAVDEKVDIESNLKLADLEALTMEMNPDLQYAMISKRLADLNLKAVKGQRYPVVGLNGGYQYSQSNSPTGFTTTQRAKGFTYGLTADINVFNGFLQRQNERNAKVEISSSALTLEKTKQDVKALLISTYQNYLTNLDLLKVETGNVDLAKENLEITFEKYRLGSISPLELREAQRNSIDAIIRFLDAQYQAKLTEINLKEVSGTLKVQ
ncbi:Outer membrane protein TolC [Pedobacter westerhofensis]|uniref:Outer membrane protein TolC n=1 Tax=Pedobacter westerhofensis TaxID=425512 RepID=A0A521BZK4_9SPHI|nr:TolC family protein [Pedobacter westerhofensis]SMO52646.1 Outer membrane protein TolC [Pedobacter westerhofensis]